MTRAVLALFVLPAALAAGLATPAPARAEESGEDGFSLMEEGGKFLFRHMLRRMKPALDEAQNDPGRTLDDLAPALDGLADYVGGLSHYYMPEVLPNGDVLIRRKVPLPARPPADPGKPNGDGTVDL